MEATGNDIPPRQTKVCRDCAKEFDYQPIFFSGREVFVPVLCRECADALTKLATGEKAADAMSEREKSWARICPDNYADTHPSRLPAQKARTAARAWIASGCQKWLGLVGESGLGKTRIAFLALRWMHDRGRDCYAIRSTTFSAAVEGQFSEDEGVRGRSKFMLKRSQSASVLLLDDLGKERYTDRVEAAFYDLIEGRMSERKMTIWTANAAGAELVGMLSADRGEAIVRRLREASEIIVATDEREPK